MRLALRLLIPQAPNQSGKAGMWQDPLHGYWESHGKMEFKAGEEYNMTEDEKKAVLERYRMKEIFKKEFIKQQYDPVRFKYQEGVLMDPAMFRWYAADMTRQEHYERTPKTVWVYLLGSFGIAFAFMWYFVHTQNINHLESEQGQILWWDRINGRDEVIPGNRITQQYHTPW